MSLLTNHICLRCLDIEFHRNISIFIIPYFLELTQLISIIRNKKKHNRKINMQTGQHSRQTHKVLTNFLTESFSYPRVKQRPRRHFAQLFTNSGDVFRTLCQKRKKSNTLSMATLNNITVVRGQLSSSWETASIPTSHNVYVHDAHSLKEFQRIGIQRAHRSLFVT